MSITYRNLFFTSLVNSVKHGRLCSRYKHYCTHLILLPLTHEQNGTYVHFETRQHHNSLSYTVMKNNKQPVTEGVIQ